MIVEGHCECKVVAMQQQPADTKANHLTFLAGFLIAYALGNVDDGMGFGGRKTRKLSATLR